MKLGNKDEKILKIPGMRNQINKYMPKFNTGTKLRQNIKKIEKKLLKIIKLTKKS